MVKTVQGSYFCVNIVWTYYSGKSSLLSLVAFGVLTFPRSNAVEERVFSITKKNKTTLQWCLD